MFSANSGTGSSAYHNVGVESIAETAAPHQLVLMLFNGARAAVAEAKGHLDRNEIAAKGGAISKAISIIDGGLKASLDLNVGGEMAKNLSDLYVYMVQRLVFANLKNDRAALDEVAKLLHELGDAWGSIAGAKPAKAPVAKNAPAVRAAPRKESAGPATLSTPMYGANAAPLQSNRTAVEPAPARDTAAPVQSHRPAAAVAQAYGAARTQTESVPVSSTAPPAIAAATPGPAAPSGSAGAAAPSSQSRRLAAAYGVR